MFVTVQTEIPTKPVVSVHGDIIKCDLGSFLIEFNREEFNNFVYQVISQAIKQDVNLNLY